MRIINLTQHPATQDQISAGVENVSESRNSKLKKLLTFETPPTFVEVQQKALELVEIAEEGGYHYAMIGGAPYLMASLEKCLRKKAIKPLYSFSVRKSVERTLEDGSVVKEAIFKHDCFIDTMG